MENFKNALDSLNNSFLSIRENYKQKFIQPSLLDEISKIMKYLRRDKASLQNVEILNLENLIQLRKLLVCDDRVVKMFALKILRYNIEINPIVTKIYKSKLFHFIICKIFDDFKTSTFEERLEALKFCHSWLKYSDSNFPFIFCQSIMATARSQDEDFKKGSIEFIRSLALINPEYCNLVGGFKSLINTLIDDNLIDISETVFNTLVCIINDESKRKYITNFSEFYRIFSIFTKSDFSLPQKEKEKEKEKEVNEDKVKLEVQLTLSKRIIDKLLKTWPGYSMLMGNFMALGSIIESINTDTNITIKKTVLDMMNDLIENESLTVDSFKILVIGDEFYVHKIYMAYILQGLFLNKLYNSLIKFIEKENNTLSDYAQKIALKFVILYSKLSNIDLQLPLLNNKLFKNNKEIFSSDLEEYNLANNANFYRRGNTQNKISLDEEMINTKIKIMNLLDKTFNYFNSSKLTNYEVADLSDTLLLAKQYLIHKQNIKKYENQYLIDVTKRELYQIDENELQNLLKLSQINSSKEFYEWDMKKIEEILDILEYRKELIMELFKQRFFKKILNAFMPSKGMFVSLHWNIEHFKFAAVGNKLFKILSSSHDGIRILDTSPEDNYFSQNKTWFDDVYSCLDTLFSIRSSNKAEERKLLNNSVFSLKKVIKSMSRQIFTYLGLISHSNIGDDYLEKRKFYSLIKKGIIHSGKFDYLITNILENLNLNSKNAADLIQYILDSGSKRIKRYIFEHIRCLFKFGKEIIWSLKNFQFTIDHDAEVGRIVLNILYTLFSEGKYIEEFLSSKPLIKKIGQLKKEILYLMMRNQEAFAYLSDFINSELESLKLDDVIETYSKELETSMSEIFSTEETSSEFYYLHINLPYIENQYDNYTELFWIKQLPFNINLGIVDESGGSNYDHLVFNTYLEFHDSNKMILYAKINEDIRINPEKHSIKFICMLGDQFIDNYCRMIYHANFLTFDYHDFKLMTKFIKPQTSEEYYRIEKDGVVINFSKVDNDFLIFSIFMYIKINPDKKIALKTPTNFITELANTDEGIRILNEKNIIRDLVDLLDSKDKSFKSKKAILWMLAKICSKENYGKDLNREYKILEKINSLFLNTKNLSLKGSICYIFSFVANNAEIKDDIQRLGWKFTFNSNICFPEKLDLLFLKTEDDPYSKFENSKIYSDFDKINKFIQLGDKTSEIYINVSNLLNSISYKQSYERLNELLNDKSNEKYFNDPNLIIRLFALLNTYKYRQPLRKYIFNLMESFFASQDLLDKMEIILEGIDKNIF